MSQSDFLDDIAADTGLALVQHRHDADPRRMPERPGERRKRRLVRRPGNDAGRHRRALPDRALPRRALPGRALPRTHETPFHRRSTIYDITPAKTAVNGREVCDGWQSGVTGLWLQPMSKTSVRRAARDIGPRLAFSIMLVEIVRSGDMMKLQTTWPDERNR